MSSAKPTTPETMAPPAAAPAPPPEPAQRGAAAQWGFPIATGALLALAALLRFETLVKRPLWFDEQVTLFLSNQARDVREFFRIASQDGFEHPALHPFVASVFLPFFDDPALAIRLPSALAGVASVGLLVWLCRELWDRSVACFAGLLLAISVYHINYSQDARAYPFLILCGLAQLLSMLTFVRGGGLRTLLPFPVLGVMGLYFHHVGTLLQAGIGLSFLGLLVLAQRDAGGDAAARRAMRQRWIGFVCVYAAILAFYAPQIPMLLGFYGAHETKIDPDAGPRVLRWLNLSPRFFHALIVRWGNGATVAPVYEFLFAVGLVALLRNARNALIVLPWLTLPFLFFGLVPFERWFDIRYLITSLPAFMVVVALGGVTLARLAQTGVVRFGASPRGLRAARSALWLLMLAPIGAAATWNYLVFRQTTVRCSEVMSEEAHASRAEQGYCQQNLVLHSLHPHAHFILRRHKIKDRRP